jgi:hypothetical protein
MADRKPRQRTAQAWNVGKPKNIRGQRRQRSFTEQHDVSATLPHRCQNAFDEGRPREVQQRLVLPHALAGPAYQHTCVHFPLLCNVLIHFGARLPLSLAR